MCSRRSPPSMETSRTADWNAPSFHSRTSASTIGSRSGDVFGMGSCTRTPTRARTRKDAKRERLGLARLVDADVVAVLSPIHHVQVAHGRKVLGPVG